MQRSGMLALGSLRHGLAAASGLVGRRAALRCITIDAYQRRAQESAYEGANEILSPWRAEKRQEIVQHRDPWEELSREQKDAARSMRELVKARRYREALDIFRGVPEKAGVLYGAALSACAKGLLLREATAIWQEMDQRYKTCFTYTTMLDLFRRLKMVSEAEELMADMAREGIEPNIVACRTMIGAYSLAGEPGKAMALFEKVRGTSLPGASRMSKQMTYLSVMSAFSRCGDYAAVRELFAEMTAAGVPPDHTHFNSLLTSCVLPGHMDIAAQIIDIMPKYGLAPRTEDFTALVSACRSDLPRCRAAFGKMRDAGVAPSSITYSSLIKAHVAGGDLAVARELLEEAESTGRLDWRARKDIQRLMSAE